MSDLIQRIKDRIRTTSEQIRNIKISAQKTERRLVCGFFRQDGSLYVRGFLLPQHIVDAKKLVCKESLADVIAANGHINPTDKRWAGYRGLKREVSIWLAAMHVARAIEKSSGASPLELGLANGHRPKNIDRKTFLRIVTKRIEGLDDKISKETAHA